MKAGRELDALVAEKVMGLVLTSPVDPRFDHSVGTNRDGSSAKRNFCRWPDGREHWIPFFSTDISDAWQVVEKLRRDGFGIIFNDTMGQYRGRFWRYNGMDGWDIDAWIIRPDTKFTVWATTAPLVICLAALKAVGVEVERCT